MPDPFDATWVSDRLARLRAGDPSARDELLTFAAGRLERLSHGLLRGQLGRVGRWAELHALVQGLPDEEQAVTDLIFYQGLTQEEAAALLGVDVRTVQRRWQRARRKLGELLAQAD